MNGAEEDYYCAEEATEPAAEAQASDDEDELYLAKYIKDHFTLPAPSNVVRYRNKRVFENKSTQIILEETYDPHTKAREITVKRLKDSTKGLQFLRAIYTLVCALWTGFFLVFCMQVLLFLILDLTVQSGNTEVARANIFNFIGVLFAIFTFIQGFASALVIASQYIIDTWSGHYLVKQFVFSKNVSEVLVDWVFFTFFIFLPVLTMCITLLAKLENWWTITSLLWLSCVILFYIIFAANVVFYEVKAAISFVRNRESSTTGTRLTLLETCKQCIILRQTHTYSGSRWVTFLARSAFETTMV
jgi:hypothetical protein